MIGMIAAIAEIFFLSNHRDRKWGKGWGSGGALGFGVLETFPEKTVDIYKKLHSPNT